MPAVIPSDFALGISIASTLTNAKSVNFDGLAMLNPIYHGGVGMAIFAGGTPMISGDRYTFPVSNSNAQLPNLLRKWYKTQSPIGNLFPSITDSWA